MTTGTAAFGPQYQIMLENDTHAPGSVDRMLFARMIKLDEESQAYLYSDYTDLAVGYGARQPPGAGKDRAAAQNTREDPPLCAQKSG
ncbi:MAG: hypothetical protein FWB76_03435 [Oscillospiraceae bacterium]|nr:hypothetical protein [Oscillospiraceae bacterium]